MWFLALFFELSLNELMKDTLEWLRSQEPADTCGSLEWQKDLEDVVLRCNSCARFRHQQRREPLQSTPMPKRPLQQVGSDLFKLDRKHYILIVDYYSRFHELRPLSNLRASNVIAACQEIFACYVIPELFVSDNGPQYANTKFWKFAT